MIIKCITVSNFGSIGFYEATLNPSLNVIDTNYIPEISAVIKFLLCSKVPHLMPDIWVQSDTRLTAEIQLNDSLYFAEATPSNDFCSKLVLKVVDSEHNDITDYYLKTLSHCLEQDAVESFDGHDKSLPLHFCWYRNCEDYAPRNYLASATNHLTETKTFRTHLLKYIKAFEPELINNKKKYKMKINSQGRFEVFYPDVSDQVCLSETEEKLFLYCCFLNIAEFWGDIETIRDLHHEKKPLLITNFLEFLDESTDIKGLIKRTIHLQRQIIILTTPLDKKTQQLL